MISSISVAISAAIAIAAVVFALLFSYSNVVELANGFPADRLESGIQDVLMVLCEGMHIASIRYHR